MVANSSKDWSDVFFVGETLSTYFHFSYFLHALLKPSSFQIHFVPLEATRVCQVSFPNVDVSGGGKKLTRLATERPRSTAAPFPGRIDWRRGGGGGGGTVGSRALENRLKKPHEWRIAAAVVEVVPVLAGCRVAFCDRLLGRTVWNPLPERRVRDVVYQTCSPD